MKKPEDKPANAKKAVESTKSEAGDQSQPTDRRSRRHGLSWRQTMGVIGFLATILIIVGLIVYYINLPPQPQRKPDSLPASSQTDDNSADVTTPQPIDNAEAIDVDAVINDSSIGSSFVATKVVIKPFVDKDSITDEGKVVVLVKFVVTASEDEIESPTSSQIALIDATGESVPASTELVESRMSDAGYTPGTAPLGRGEIRTGYEAYFVKKDRLKTLKISFVRLESKELPEKTFSANLF